MTEFALLRITFACSLRVHHHFRSQAADPCTEIMRTYTEEGKKVERNNGPKLPAVFRRVSDDCVVAKCSATDFWAYKEDDVNDAEDDEDGGAAGGAGGDKADE